MQCTIFFHFHICIRFHCLHLKYSTPFGLKVIILILQQTCSLPSMDFPWHHLKVKKTPHKCKLVATTTNLSSFTLKQQKPIKKVEAKLNLESFTQRNIEKIKQGVALKEHWTVHFILLLGELHKKKILSTKIMYGATFMNVMILFSLIFCFTFTKFIYMY